MGNVTSAQLRSLGIAIAGGTTKSGRKRRRPKSKAFVEFSCQRTDRGVCITFPIEVVSESNKHGHWTERNERRQQQHAVIGMLIGQAHPFPQRPLMVTLTRLGPKRLDRDNNVAGLKACQDAIADALGVDDGNLAAVDWDYQQEPGNPYGVRVRIEAAKGQGQ